RRQAMGKPERHLQCCVDSLKSANSARRSVFEESTQHCRWRSGLPIACRRPPLAYFHTSMLLPCPRLRPFIIRDKPQSGWNFSPPETD
ncbi:MAG: hypothetical protein QM579_01065, partial [Desulfovibrio sp.]|uniref:hypothetical protein n=1 Tax=Desulfovibrio sp. TaxID=885 RepID=UPI0039E34C66